MLKKRVVKEKRTYFYFLIQPPFLIGERSNAINGLVASRRFLSLLLQTMLDSGDDVVLKDFRETDKIGDIAGGLHYHVAIFIRRFLGSPQGLRRDQVELDNEYFLIDKCSYQIHGPSHTAFILKYFGIQSHIEGDPGKKFNMVDFTP